MPSAYPFAFAAARYLEPPTRSHHPMCATEGGTWYECDTGTRFERREGNRNICPVCGEFAHRIYTCTCDRLIGD